MTASLLFQATALPRLPRLRPEPGDLRVSGIIDQSIVDGPGLRLTVFAQGCPHHCPGCHNPGTHSFSGGFSCGIDEILARFDDNPLLAGITLSGGEPFAQPETLSLLCDEIRSRGKTIWCFTGFTFEELLRGSRANAAILRLLGRIDVLVDGRFVQSRRDASLLFRGSANQRLLDIPASLRTGKAVELA